MKFLRSRIIVAKMTKEDFLFFGVNKRPKLRGTQLLTQRESEGLI